MNWDRRVKSSDVKDKLGSMLKGIKDGPWYIERYSEVVAVLVSYEEWEKLCTKTQKAPRD